MDYIYHYGSPLGGMTMASDGIALIGLWFDDQKYFASTLGRERECKLLPVFDVTTTWLDTYFAGREPDFTPRLSMKGSQFRQAVWEILRAIPFGKTETYGAIASIIAAQCNLRCMSAQAVGGAVGHNPISLIIPCHRVVSTNGSLTGYAGGIERKQKLLALEECASLSKL